MTSGPAPPDDDGGDQELAEVDALEDRLRIGGHGGSIPPGGPLRVLTPPLRCGKTRRTLAPLRPGPVSVLARVPGGPDVLAAGRRASLSERAERGGADLAADPRLPVKPSLADGIPDGLATIALALGSGNTVVRKYRKQCARARS